MKLVLLCQFSQPLATTFTIGAGFEQLRLQRCDLLIGEGGGANTIVELSPYLLVLCQGFLKFAPGVVGSLALCSADFKSACCRFAFGQNKDDFD